MTGGGGQRGGDGGWGMEGLLIFSKSAKGNGGGGGLQNFYFKMGHKLKNGACF